MLPRYLHHPWSFTILSSWTNKEKWLFPQMLPYLAQWLIFSFVLAVLPLYQLFISAPEGPEPVTSLWPWTIRVDLHLLVSCNFPAMLEFTLSFLSDEGHLLKCRMKNYYISYVLLHSNTDTNFEAQKAPTYYLILSSGQESSVSWFSALGS